MGTEILRPQDCLIERIRVSPCRRRNYYYGNGGGFYASNLNTTTIITSSGSNTNARSNRKPAARSERPDHQRKRSPEKSISKRSSSADDVRSSRSHGSNNLVMEKVTILRRGESLDSKVKTAESDSKKEQTGGGGDMVVTGTERLGPAPEMVSKPARIVDLRSPVAADMYAGSAFSVSPAPSSLPLPSFKKKQVTVDDLATRDLRRLLRLDF
ncbi:hypothetical protein Tsubulata_032511 [Turnera subulata]|uniref:Uncharacterized protein n=1 Tax=Turnera subulata TaxID=218843 RepID=A0A9Q0F406_9ROSI|nr:hypothetical protein Tsubulata_032511 [Turnera subulata]